MSLYTVDFQKSIIKLLCTNVKFVHEFGILLKEEYFESQPHRILFGIINNFVLTYEKEISEDDLLVLADDYILSKGYSSDVYSMLKEEIKEIFKIFIKSEQFIIDQLIKYCKRQELKNAILKSVDILEKDGSSEEVLKLIDAANSIGFGGNEGLSYEDLTNFPQLYRKRYNPTKLVRTGFNKYDAALSGGMAPGELHVIQGSPKQGKSTFACNIGINSLVTNKTVYHISGELKEIDVMAKYATRFTGMTYQQLTQCTDDEYKVRIAKFDKYRPNLFVNYWTQKSFNAMTIRSWISRKRSMSGKSPDLIIVDYDDLLVPVSGGSGNMYDDAGEVYSDLIALADYFQCPVLTLAQPKREAWEKANKGEVMYSFDLAHSARKVHACFSLSSINFPDEGNDGILYVDLVRRGDSSIKIPIKKDLSRGLFQEKD